jgi:predicted NAD/FAD-binding protein
MHSAPRLAVIGAGIAGLYAAWRLDAMGYRVDLFERHGRLGGHTDTHEVMVAGSQVTVDTGFIVFNRRDYPRFSAMLDAIGLDSQPTCMSFSAHDPADPSWAYAAGRRGGLFASPGSRWSRSHWRMLAGIVRFYRRGRRDGPSLDPSLTLGEALDRDHARVFAERHLLPMVSALWSCSLAEARDYPLRDLLEYMHAHGMLALFRRPTWETLRGGSRRYIDALQSRWGVAVHVDHPIERVEEAGAGQRLRCRGAWLDTRYDGVVFACHADQALAMLAAPSEAEREVLGAIGFVDNSMLLHTDDRVMPPDRRTWASWNVRLAADADGHCHASYWMNRLQRLSAGRDLFVSLNQDGLVDPAQVLKRRRYRHPRYDRASMAARRALPALNDGSLRRWYCGAWSGWGFHEDGAGSAAGILDAVRARLPA